jgi:hypothetical protein
MSNELLYGFVELEDLAARRVYNVGVEVIIEAIEQSTAEYERQLEAMMASFVEMGDLHKERYRQPGSGTLQPLDENGNPKPVRLRGYYDVAFPIQGGGTAWGTNRVTRAKMTVQEANEETMEATRRDADWVRRHVLAAIFDNVSWTFDDEEFGNLTIEPLANGDTVEYVFKGGDPATDDHYLYQNATIDDTNNPFGTLYDELMEHVGNEPPVIAYVASNLTEDAEGLTAFTEVGDPDLRYGVNTDLVDDPIQPYLGDEVLGKANKCWVVEWRALPDDYIIAHAVGGGPPVFGRQHPEGELQGIITETAEIEGNLEVQRLIRYAGFGVRRRVAAAVMQIDNGSYSIPSGYDAPLSV